MGEIPSPGEEAEQSVDEDELKNAEAQAYAGNELRQAAARSRARAKSKGIVGKITGEAALHNQEADIEDTLASREENLAAAAYDRGEATPVRDQDYILRHAEAEAYAGKENRDEAAELRQDAKESGIKGRITGERKSDLEDAKEEDLLALEKERKASREFEEKENQK